MPKPPAERVRDAENRKRAAGQREIRVWVPDNEDDIQAVRSFARELCSKRAAQSDA